MVIGLDFLSFNESNVPPPTFSKAQLRWHPWPTNESVATLTPWDALYASVTTLRVNRSEPDQAVYRWEAPKDNPMSDGRVRAFREYLPVVMGNSSLYPGYRLDESRVAELRAIVERCEALNIDVRLFITPMHATHLDALYDAGLGDEYESWIHTMADVAPVWNFSGYNAMTTEPLRDTMRYYLDTLHYSSRTGHLIITRLYDDGESTPPDDFGRLVDASDADAHVQALRASREAWLASEERAEMQAILTR